MFKSFLKEHKLSEYDFSHKLFPDVSDREYWDNYKFRELIEEAEAHLGYSWPVVTASSIMAFKMRGDRKAMEKIHFARRHALASLVFGELSENHGRFIEDIVNGLFAICEETYWGLSAHWFKEVGNIPSATEHYIDLFAAETAEHVAMTCYLLKKPLLEYCPEIVERIEYELERRIKTPYLDHTDFYWMGYRQEETGRPPNNWNPWIISNVLSVFLLTENDRARLDSAIGKMFVEIGHYFDGLPDDGGCDEGPDYWGRAGASLFEFIYEIKEATGGALDLFDYRYNDCRMSKRLKSLFAADYSADAKSQKRLFESKSLQQKSTNFLSKFVSKSKICSRNSRISTFDCRYNENYNEKLRGVVAYMKKVHIKDADFICVADCTAAPKITLGPFIYAFGKETKQPDIVSLGKEVTLAEGDKCKIRFAVSGEGYRRRIYVHKWISEMEKEDTGAVKHSPIELMQDLEVALLRAGDWCLVMKGGYNHESHNHNDVGSFALYFDGAPVLCDIGIGTYTKKTFSPQRYEIPWTRSLTHNIPEINGAEQSFGREYTADGFSVTEGRAEVSFAKAYPDKAEIVSLKREYALCDAGVEFTDKFEFSGDKKRVSEALVTTLDVKFAENGIILGGKYLVTYSHGKPKTEFISFEGDDKLIKPWKCEGVTRIVIETDGEEKITFKITRK